MNKNELKEVCNMMNTVAINNQDGDKEYVEDIITLKAKKIVDELKPQTTEDVLLYCSALNVLNSAVKQKNRIINYYFKRNVIDVLVRSIVEYDIQNVDYCISRDNNMTICYVKVNDIMFSFHQITISEQIKDLVMKSKHIKDIEFDGIRKQKCSKTLFNIACSRI